MESKILEVQVRENGVKLGSPPSSDQKLLSLLEETENLLTKMDQFPSLTMISALQSMATSLAAKGIMMHPNDDVRVAVTLCICEVIRITAPEAPYDDDLMKEVFVRIVESFTRIDDMKSSSFLKRVSILETVAKVKCCILMLDLDCDDLVLEMFHQFLQRISLKNKSHVFSYMETIMSTVLEESEEISKDLLSCFFWSVRKERMVGMLASYRLGEKVISNCANKLRPLLEVLMGNNVKDFSEVVTALCQEASAKNTMVVQGIEAPVIKVPPTQTINRPSHTIKRTWKAVEAEVLEKEFIKSKRRVYLGKQTQLSDSDEDASRHISIKDTRKNAKSTEIVSESIGLKRKWRLEKLKKKTAHQTIEKREDKESNGKKLESFDESIVGERIKVWWPRDKAFYNATVKEYNCSKKRHTVTYDDGDIEMLYLNKEVWEFIQLEAQDTPTIGSSMMQKEKATLLDVLKETPKRSKDASTSKAKEPVQTSKPGFGEEKYKSVRCCRKFAHIDQHF